MEGPKPKCARIDGSSQSLQQIVEACVNKVVASKLRDLQSPSTSDRLSSACGPEDKHEERIAILESELNKLKDAHELALGELSTMRKELESHRKERLEAAPKKRKASQRVNGSNSEETASAANGELRGSLTLKVGSKKFETTADTLRSIPDTFLASLVSGRWKKEKDGSMFIDRSAKHFQYVLDYLRCRGENFVPPASTTAQDELCSEAKFYCLNGLAASLRRLRVASSHLMTATKKGAVLAGNRYAAAMLDVCDPNNFKVTFSFDASHSLPDYIIGIAPASSKLSSEWLIIGTPKPGSPPQSRRGFDYDRSMDLFGYMSDAPPTFFMQAPDDIQLPPAARSGIFLLSTRQKLQDSACRGSFYYESCYCFLTGDARVLAHQWNVSSEVERLECAKRVQLHFVRNSEGCSIEFGWSANMGKQPLRSRQKIDLRDAGLDANEEFVPFIFFVNSGLTAMVEELMS